MKKIITFGTFDVLHVGHLRMLKRAAQFGEHLSVGVSSDELSVSKKGRVPIYSLEQRMELIQAISLVDCVFTEYSLEEKRSYIVDHAADVLVIGDDWQGKFDHLSDVCDVVYLPRTRGISTTATIERIRS